MQFDLVFTDRDGAWSGWLRRGVLNTRRGAGAGPRLTATGARLALVSVLLEPRRRPSPPGEPVRWELDNYHDGPTRACRVGPSCTKAQPQPELDFFLSWSWWWRLWCQLTGRLSLSSSSLSHVGFGASLQVFGGVKPKPRKPMSSLS